MIWKRDQYIAHCQFEYTGREMFCELFGPLLGLPEEWRSQGATEKEIALTAFDWDYVLLTGLAGNHGAITNIEPVIIEDTPEYQITRDSKGRLNKLCKYSATIGQPLEYPVKTMDDWLKIKHWYAFSEDRINKEKLLEQKKLHDQGYLTIACAPGAFFEPRELMGEENFCIALYEEPELVEDMLATMADTATKVMERVGEIVPIDNLQIGEDMAGKSGPLLGPHHVREFFMPYYKKVWDCARAYGAKLFSIDSDGNLNAIVDALIECGVKCIYPNEPAAGMDIVQLRKKYGKKLYLKGGIDKLVLRDSKEAIRKELEYKMCDALKGGGTIFGLDHRIPNGVPIENYRYYVQLGRELLGLPPISGEGWRSMAF